MKKDQTSLPIEATIKGITYKGEIIDSELTALLVSVLYEDREREKLAERGLLDAVAILTEQGDTFAAKGKTRAEKMDESEWVKDDKGVPSFDLTVSEEANTALIEDLFLRINCNYQYKSELAYLMWSIFPSIPPSICRPPNPQTGAPGTWRAPQLDTIEIIGKMLQALMDSEPDTSGSKPKVARTEEEAIASQQHNIKALKEAGSDVREFEPSPDGNSTAPPVEIQASEALESKVDIMKEFKRLDPSKGAQIISLNDDDIPHNIIAKTLQVSEALVKMIVENSATEAATSVTTGG